MLLIDRVEAFFLFPNAKEDCRDLLKGFYGGFCEIFKYLG